MAVTIISESYGPRKPFVTCTAASTDELADYVGLWAEGSEATISDTKYVLDKTNGWVLPGQSGKELPAVTAEDDGDVLTVVSGAWGKAAPSGGGGGSGVLVVTGTWEGEIETLNKTWQEIHDAVEAGTMVIYQMVYDSYIDLGYLMIVSEGNSSGQLQLPWIVSFLLQGEELTVVDFDASSASDYPAHDGSAD